jgi:hypothetical protein
MDALRNLVDNVPVWLTQLDKIGQRQAEPAASTDETSTNRSNKGSTECLNPEGEGTVLPKPSPGPEPGFDPSGTAASRWAGAVTQKRPSPPTMEPPPLSSPGAGTPTALRTESAVSAEGASAKHRSMAIVYYDGGVQSSFEDLVKSISESQNLIWKARTKRLAVEMPDEDESRTANAGDDGPLTLPSNLRRSWLLRNGTPSAMAGRRSLLGDYQQPDVYDELVKDFECVRPMLEHAAHQFLRGKGDEEIADLKLRLAKTGEQAQRAMQRVFREEQEPATSKLHKPRQLPGDGSGEAPILEIDPIHL